MNAYRNELLSAFRRATSLVKQLLDREITVEQFTDEYDNFFYYEALDGHEADEQQKLLLREFSDVISFHENIQTKVIDLIYFESSNQKQQYLDVGRIDVEHAELRIRSLANVHDIENLLKRLN